MPLAFIGHTPWLIAGRKLSHEETWRERAELNRRRRTGIADFDEEKNGRKEVNSLAFPYRRTAVVLRSHTSGGIHTPPPG